MLRYRNPVYPNYFADPFVWKCHDLYYAVGTGPVATVVNAGENDFTTYVVGGEHFAFPLLRSADLIHWELLGGAVRVPPQLIGGRFWAPEVTSNGRVFYLYYSVAMSGLNHKLRVAMSDRPEGPFDDLGLLMPDADKCPFAIDAHAFRDDDGEWYLFYASDYLEAENGCRAGTALTMDRLVNMTRLARQPRTVERARYDWQRFESHRHLYGRTFDWHTLEGPCVRKHEGRYYCFYSGGCYENESYGVDYCVADKITGPYSSEGAEKGPRVLRTVPGRVVGPGHQSIVTGPDGRSEYVVYHAWDPGRAARRMCLDPLVWSVEGPRCAGPTWDHETSG